MKDQVNKVLWQQKVSKLKRKVSERLVVDEGNKVKRTKNEATMVMRVCRHEAKKKKGI